MESNSKNKIGYPAVFFAPRLNHKIASFATILFLAFSNFDSSHGLITFTRPIISRSSLFGSSAASCARKLYPISFVSSSASNFRISRYISDWRRTSKAVASLPARMNNAQEEDEEMEQPKLPTKSYSMTVCMVPPPEVKKVWDSVTKARTEMRDPGLYRWPPHANLLYPFLETQSNTDGTTFDEKMADSLQKAVEQCNPFQVSLETFGTFGGKSRGVLYLYPQSSREEEQGVDTEHGTEPIKELQSILEQNFPECVDKKKNKEFIPHMTISHFPSLGDALEAQTQLEKWWVPMDFLVEEIYVLKREGDGGQFKILMTLPLGRQSNQKSRTEDDIVELDTFRRVQVHDPPKAFPCMPLVEEDWVLEERMKLKQRRNRRGSRGGKGRNRTRKTSRGPRRSTTDTPEVIAQKRAERAAKKERLEREAAAAASKTSFEE